MNEQQKPHDESAPHETWIAHRALTDASGQLALHLFLSAPRRTDEGRWICIARLETTVRPGASGPIQERHEAHGVDALQALVNGVAALRWATRERRDLAWVGGKGAGVPGALPLVFGQDFHDRAEKLVDVAVGAHAEELKAAHAGKASG